MSDITLSSVESAFADLVASLKSRITDMNAKLPAEAQLSPAQIEQLASEAFGSFNWTALERNVIAELVQLLSTGESEVVHDPTEVV